MAVMRTRFEDGIVPVSHSFDFDTGNDVIFDDVGPFWVAVTMWVHTAGGPLASAVNASIDYVDPTGNTFSEGVGSGLNLQDINSISKLQPTSIVRLNKSSSWNFNLFLVAAGGNPANADGALISYRVMVLPGDAGETGNVPF